MVQAYPMEDPSHMASGFLDATYTTCTIFALHICRRVLLCVAHHLHNADIQYHSYVAEGGLAHPARGSAAPSGLARTSSGRMGQGPGVSTTTYTVHVLDAD